MSESHTCVNFVVVNDLVVLVFLSRTYVDRFLNSAHPFKRKIDPHHSPPVPILTVHKTNSETKKNKTETHKAYEELVLWVAPTRCKTKSVTVAGKGVLTGMYETPVEVSAQTAGLTKVNIHAN